MSQPYLRECEDEIHTPEMGTRESSETLKSLEFDCKGQKNLALGRFLCHWKDIKV
jgi:hypothetical protein